MQWSTRTLPLKSNSVGPGFVILSDVSCLHRMYARTGEEVDLTALPTLRRVGDKLAAAVEEHFRVVYMRQSPEVLLTLSPYFLVAWQVCAHLAFLICIV